jgi:hypothetical protein
MMCCYALKLTGLVCRLACGLNNIKFEFLFFLFFFFFFFFCNSGKVWQERMSTFQV